MKQLIYVLVLIVFFGCKKEVKNKVDNIDVKKDSIGLSVNKNILTTDTYTEQNDTIYKWFKPEEFSRLDRRTVKAKSGLNIRDSIGNKIGKLDFGEVVYILNYSIETKEIKDNGKTVKGRIAKIVTKWSSENIKTGENSYKHNWYVLKENIGYVFEGFLYENNRSDTQDALYNYGYLVLGEKGEDSKIDLSELITIKKVSLEKYQNRIIEVPEFIQPKTFKKIDKTIELPFENGKKLVLKDTTLNSEYNPTRSYGVFYHKDFPGSYMVTESIFFMPDIYTEINIKTGDTLNRFDGYPYISPKKNYAVLVTHDLTECYHDTYFEIHEKGANNKYKRLLSINPNSWSYPFKKNSQSSIDDAFSIHWLSDNEFVISAVNYIDDCYEPEKLSEVYYLKFKIKI